MTKTIIPIQILPRKWRTHLTAFTTLFLFIFILHGCKKNDFSVAAPAHDADFVQKFFAIKYPVKDTIAGIIAKLKAENDRTGFVNKLPANCGLPVWDKLVLKKKQRNSFTSGDDNGDTIIILPLTNNDASLSAIITAIPDNDGYVLNCYTNNWLYNICHATNVDTAYANKQLTFFFFVENQTFGTTKFYHIPANLISRSAFLDSDGTKTITIAPAPDPVQGFMFEVCIYYVCPVCYGQDPNCPIGGHWMECFNTGSDGGDGGGSTGNTGSGTGGQSGGGSGGNGNGPGGGTTCPLTTNTTWYGLMPPPDPCGGGTTPTTVQDTIYNVCASADSLAVNSSFQFIMQHLKDSVTSNREYADFAIRLNNVYGLPPSLLELHGEANQLGLPDFAPQILFDAVFHSHFYNDSAKGLPVFSPDDLWSMATMFLEGSMNNPATFTMALVTAKNTQYILKIENVTKFRAWAQQLTAGKFNIFYYLYGGPAIGIKPTNTNDVNERQFLKFIQKMNGDSGLRLFRGNNDFTSWTPIIYNNNGNNVVTAPCQ